MSDLFFLQQAIALAKNGGGFTSPNPLVGAVLVKGNVVVGAGYHKKAGAAHAEIVAIHDATKSGKIDGATLYVTLEPCCHHGKTPPCTEAIVRAGVRRVYVGMKDPHHQVNGKGIAYLRKNGIQVDLLPKKHPTIQEVRMLSQPFLKWTTTGMPYVTLKAAVSLDGKIATRSGDAHWITGDLERKDARNERSLADAVLVGSGTVQADNPVLAQTHTFARKKFTRIILDPELSLHTGARVFRDEHVVLITTKRASQARQHAFAKKNIFVKVFSTERVSIISLLEFLSTLSIQHVFVEGGGAVHGSFIDASFIHPGVVDKVIWYTAPILIGGVTAPSAVGGAGSKNISKVPRLKHVTYEPIGKSMKTTGYLNLY